MQSISVRLLRRVLSVYLLVTMVVFIGQMTVELRLEQRKVQESFELVERTFSSSLTNAAWNLDTEQLQQLEDDGLCIVVGGEGFTGRGVLGRARLRLCAIGIRGRRRVGCGRRRAFGLHRRRRLGIAVDRGGHAGSRGRRRVTICGALEGARHGRGLNVPRD